MEKREIILPSREYAKAPEINLQTKIGLESSEELLREGDKDIVLDIDRLFNKERNESNKYKIYGKVKMVFKNLYSGSTGYDPLLNSLYLSGDGSDGNFSGFLPYNEFAFLRRDLYKEVVNPPDVTIGNNVGTYTGYTTTIVNGSEHQYISMMEAPYHNWNFYLSYVYTGDPEYNITYTLTGGTKTSSGNKAKNGIPSRVSDQGTYYRLTTPVPHGISEGESVVINNIAYSILRIGNEVYNSENYVIDIDKTQLSGTTLSGIAMIKRCLDINDVTGTTCSYYVHKHKTLTEVESYIMDKIGFESSIFEDEKKLLFENAAGDNDVLVERNRMESVIFDFRDSFILTGLTNNLGFTPTEIYATIIFRNGSGYFEYPPKVGYKLHLHDSWVDDHFSGTTANETSLTGQTWTSSGYTFISGNTLSTGSTLTGAFVEYDPVNRTERIISEALHKITQSTSIFDFNQDDPTYYSGTSANNKVGIFYQPHYMIKLRQLSPYIETSNTNNIYDLPENAQYDEKSKLWKWRDLYDHGFIDDQGFGTDFSFVNGQHYVKSDINFYLRNEKIYTNKSDGLIKFGKKKTDC